MLATLSSSAPLYSQSSPNIESVAERMSIEVQKAHTKRVLVAPESGCLLDSLLCAQFESNLRSALGRANPNAQFVDRNDLVVTAQKHGLVALDVYDKQVLVNLAFEAGAEALIEENISWEADHFELQTRLYEARTGQIKKRIATRIVTSVSGDDPLVYRDSESSVSLIISKRKTNDFRVFRYPECVSCRMPDQWKASGPVESVSVLMTITDGGTIQQMVVTQSTSQRATERTLEVIKGWQFKPAIDSDGKPFAARILVTVGLTAPPCPAALPEHGDSPNVVIGPPGAFQPCPALPRQYPQRWPD
jgi:hypothetical protein